MSETFDIAIVGAGIAGASLAAELAGHARVAAGGVDTSKAIIARRLLGLPNALGKPELPQR